MLHAHAAEPASLTFAAGEHVPYIGSALPENGYVAELVREAFARAGYRVKIEFYPWARAQLLAEKGEINGLLPVFRERDANAGDGFLYSAPFPGDTIGLLKRKDFDFPYSQADVEHPEALLASMKRLRIGMVRGGVTPSLLSNAKSLAIETVNDDVQNLDKLERDRIQLALIDKYTAADLMVNQRPHLVGKLEFLKPALEQREFRVGFPVARKDAKQLAAAFNEGLSGMRSDGTLERILKKHGLFIPPKGDQRKVQLVIGTVNNSDMERMQSLSAEFERSHPDIRLVWRVLDENTLRLRLLSDLAISDGQFDVMTIGTYETPLWARRGWIVPLNPPESYDVNDLVPTVRQGLSHNGRLYALPFYAESSMTYYRKDLFARAGIAMPAAPAYADILRFAARLHDPANGVYGICLRGKPGWGENMAFIGTMVNAYGGRWFDEAWRPDLDTPAWEAALKMYRDLLKYGPPDAGRNGFNENLKLFAQGSCGMWIDATVAAGTLFDAKHSHVALQLGYAAAPTAVTAKGAAWLWSWALAVPSSSTHQKEAAEFVAWATSKEYVQSVAKQYGWVAVPPGTRKSTYLNPAYASAAPFAKFVINAIEQADMENATAKPKPYLGIQYVGIPEFPAIGNMVGAEVAKAVRSEQSMARALSRAQERVLEQMKSSGYLRTD